MPSTSHVPHLCGACAGPLTARGVCTKLTCPRNPNRKSLLYRQAVKHLSQHGGDYDANVS